MVKTSCQRVRQDSTRWGINREKLDRIRVSIGAKNPQTMRFSQGLGTRILAGAEGLEPSARGFGVDVEKRKRERGKGGVAQFFRTNLSREVLVWCCGIIQCPEMGGKLLNPITYIDENRHRHMIRNEGKTSARESSAICGVFGCCYGIGHTVFAPKECEPLTGTNGSHKKFLCELHRLTVLQQRSFYFKHTR